mgnify:CR=1 FL=1
MNIIIYTVLILVALYFLLRFFAAINSKKISQSIRILLFIGLIAIAVLFAVAGKFLLTLPLTVASLALLKLKGLSFFQLISTNLLPTLYMSECTAGSFAYYIGGKPQLATLDVHWRQATIMWQATTQHWRQATIM